ncbi:hypothetical protein [uncultured Gimesia sp.]|uniref:hypothetical protein n=1 Tax=uncultured Gimesia sp. TaxID=1678688 RepID=UPI000C5EA488|nr:hypothetical protein [Gimesia sp.]HBL48327.1 hypothetical protein [Planctomycetaceae bacterium]
MFSHPFFVVNEDLLGKDQKKVESKLFPAGLSLVKWQTEPTLEMVCLTHGRMRSRKRIAPWAAWKAASYSGFRAVSMK